MNPCQGYLSGSCNGLMDRLQQMQGGRPLGVSGNGNHPVIYPYGTTPVKYTPSGSSSVGRGAWEGWRYGSGYVGPNEGRVYGEPDYKYYRHNYCGPCGCAPEGFMGDPNGKNPNIRYIQLDPRSLFGQGMTQPQSATSPLYLGSTPPQPSQTSCGRNHCTHCTGLRPGEKPVKFQVNVGTDPCCPDPQRQQSLKVYIPQQMIPQQYEECNTANAEECTGDDCEGGGGDGDTQPQVKCQPKKQDFEIHIPGLPPGSNQGDTPCQPCAPRKTFCDPCGNCNACKGSKSDACKPWNPCAPSMVGRERHPVSRIRCVHQQLQKMRTKKGSCEVKGLGVSGNSGGVAKLAEML